MLDQLGRLAVSIPSVNIPVGDHVHIGKGLTAIDIDTVWETAVAAAIVLGLGFYLRAKVTAEVPGRLQIFWEFVVGSVSDQVEASLGPKYRRVVPLGVGIFMLVLVADWLELLPGLYRNTDYFPSPSADINFTLAMGLTVFVLFTAAGIRARGLGGYLKHFFRKPIALAPLNLLEEIVKPFTLALRLFGNIFAGGIMIALILALSHTLAFAPASFVLSIVWKLFDMFIGVIQAFIFALLTILYYQFATETEGAH
jgi:F-type H+-transporting ATPase subunit a